MQPKFHFDAECYRQSLKDLPQTAAWERLDPPTLTQIHVPPTHSKALSPEVSIVEGMRGAGKSFWTAVLASNRSRDFVSGSAGVPGLGNALVCVGFGLDLSNSLFPTAHRMDSLMSQGIGADAIWRSVLIRQGLKALDEPLPFDDTVEGAARWIVGNRDDADITAVRS